MDVTRHERWLRGPRTALVALAAVAVVVAILALPVPRPFDAPARQFATSPPTVLWLFLLCVQGGAWAVCVLALRARLSLLSQYRRAAARRIWGSTAFVAALALVPSLTPVVMDPVGSPLPGHMAKMVLLNLLGIAVAVPGIAGIFTVDAAVSAELDAPRGELGEAFRYVELRRHLARFGAVLGTIVALALLSSGALRTALAAWTQADPIPVELVWLYGAYFSILLALIYVPAYLRLLGAGERLADELCPQDAPPPAGTAGEAPAVPPRSADLLREYATCRKTVDELLSLHVSAAESFRTAAFIASPLAAALASSLLGIRIG